MQTRAEIVFEHIVGLATKVEQRNSLNNNPHIREARMLVNKHDMESWSEYAKEFMNRIRNIDTYIEAEQNKLGYHP